MRKERYSDIKWQRSSFLFRDIDYEKCVLRVHAVVSNGLDPLVHMCVNFVQFSYVKFEKKNYNYDDDQHFTSNIKICCI